MISFLLIPCKTCFKSGIDEGMSQLLCFTIQKWVLQYCKTFIGLFLKICRTFGSFYDVTISLSNVYYTTSPLVLHHFLDFTLEMMYYLNPL